MPSDVLDKLLDRDLSRVAAGELTKVTRPLLQELVNHGTRVFQRCQACATGGENEDIGVMVLYLHMLQMTDGVDVLVYESCAGAAIPVLRSSFESYLAISYILAEDYTRRSLSWFAGFLLNGIAYRETMDLSNPKSSAIDSAPDLRETLKVVAPQVTDEIRRWKSILDKPEMRPIADEVRARRKKRQPWYAAFGGPASLEQLATRLGMSAHYAYLYRSWSAVAHANDLLRFMVKTPEGYAINSLRDATNLRSVAHLTALFMLSATRLLIDHYRQGEDLKPWYLREVRPLLAQLGPLPDLE